MLLSKLFVVCSFFFLCDNEMKYKKKWAFVLRVNFIGARILFPFLYFRLVFYSFYQLIKLANNNFILFCFILLSF